MRRPLIAVVAAVAVILTGATVLAQGVITDVFTPPLQKSNIVQIPIDMHPGGPAPPWAGWAGGRMKMHLMPTGEMDVLSLTPVASGPGSRLPVAPFTGLPTGPAIISPFGPQSNNVASSPLFFTAWHPNAQGSGIPLTASVNQPVFDLVFHVKNSSPTGNDNTDATFMFWNIWHVQPTPGSTFITLNPSAYLWVRSSINNIDLLHVPGQSFYQFPTNPATVNDPIAHWLHITDPVVFHLPGGPGSQFYATFLNTALLHIEHVPEPGSALLLVAGVFSAATGLWFRRRRRKLAA